MDRLAAVGGSPEAPLLDRISGCLAETVGEVLDDLDVVDCAVATDDPADDHRPGNVGAASQDRIAGNDTVDFLGLRASRRHGRVDARLTAWGWGRGGSDGGGV